MKHFFCFYHWQLYRLKDLSQKHYFRYLQQFRQISSFFLCTSASLGDFRSIIVLNNAKIYWNAELIKMCETADVILIRLSFYSSDYNSIEILFALLKTWTRKHKELTASYMNNDDFEEFLKNAIREQTDVKNSKNLFCWIDIAYTTSVWYRFEINCMTICMKNTWIYIDQTKSDRD